MTAQVGDRFFLEGDGYSIVALSNPIQFQPEEYGMIPEACCTACWNGYWCDYHISEEGIRLQNLYIHTKDEIYPKINGIGPEEKSKKYHLYMGHCLYRNLDLPMEYTGKILVGKDFIRTYYMHMGYQRAWAYEVLKELVFENGKLVQTVDHSHMAKQLREEIESRTVENGGKDDDIRQFVKKSFSLKLEDKAWWLL